MEKETFNCGGLFSGIGGFCFGFEKNNFVLDTASDINPSKAVDSKLNDAMTDLLVSHDGSVEDKIATVKTAQIADQRRFDAAFKTLMKR